MIDTLCFSGGGIKGISFLGAINYLEEVEFINLKNINNYVGTSVGSIMSFLFILGYSAKELIDFSEKFDFKKFQIEINCNNFLSNLGIDSGIKIMTAIKTFLKERFDVDDITFIDLFNLTNKNFKVITTNYSTSKLEIFSHQETPNVSVLLAIRMSISVPFIFTPVKHNNHYYVDGGISCNFGLFYCNRETTLGLMFHNETKINELDTFTNYFKNICKVFMLSSTQHLLDFYDDKGGYNILKIICSQKNSFEFSINNEKINSLLNDGKESSEKYYNNFVVSDILENMILIIESDNLKK